MSRRRYLVLALAVGALAASLTALARRPRAVEAPASAPVPAPVETLALEVRAGSVRPGRATVPKGHRVRLSVTSLADRPLRFALAGYQDRVSIALPAHGRWTGEFLADRPGSDFTWLVQGEPAGRLVVAGSHLVEGHR